MSALSHYLEDEGIATTGISLVREHSERLRPPRALWVPFSLGRPLGVPHDAGLQHRVIDAALGLLGAPSGPVLEDFTHAAGEPEPAVAEGWTCPVPLARPERGSDSIAAALAAEVGRLAPWYERARARRGRTGVGLSGLEIEAAARRLGDFASGDFTALEGSDDTPVSRLKWITEDLKAFFVEAVSERPDPVAARDIERWLFRETALGRALFAARDACAASNDPALRAAAASSLVPRSQLPPPAD